MIQLYQTDITNTTLLYEFTRNMYSNTVNSRDVVLSLFT